MAQKNLTTSYLAKLSNANHDGVTQQICDRLRDFEKENMMLIQAIDGVHTARQAEDTAYRRFSGKDFASDDLKAADRLEDQYMSTVETVAAGDLVGNYPYCLDGDTAPTSIVAVMPSVVYVVDGADLERHYRQSPAAERMGRDFIAYRLGQVKSHIYSHYFNKGTAKKT